MTANCLIMRENNGFNTPVFVLYLITSFRWYSDDYLPQVVKLRMYEKGLSQSSLAAMPGMNQSKISEILSGKSEPTLKQARTMVVKLDISPAVVLGV